MKIPHSCRSAIITCIDFRFQKFITGFTAKLTGGFDRIAIAGGVKNLPFILGQIELSSQLHHIKEVYLINHEDCGAYGSAGTLQKHKQDLKTAQQNINKRLPDLKITLFYLKLDGEFVKV